MNITRLLKTLLGFIFFILIVFYSESKEKIESNPEVESEKIDKNSRFNVADKTLAIIYNQGESTVVLKSHLRPGLEGLPRTLKDVIFEKLMIFDAQNLKIAITEADVDRHLLQVQKQFKLSLDETIKLFKQMGYTYEEGRDQLKTKLMIENIIEYRVKSKIILDKKIVQQYYDEHPKYQEATSEVCQAFYRFGESSPALTTIKIENAIHEGTIDNFVKWGTPFFLKENEIASEKEFIKKLNPGEVSIINKTEEGIFLIKLVSKTPRYLISLQERETEIMNIIGQELFAKKFEEYRKKLLEEARIKFTDPEAKNIFYKQLESK